MTQERKHTPGPWKVFRSFKGDIGFNVIGIGEVNGEGVTDCGFGVWRSGVEADANACLIAAAPDLYEALEDLVENDCSEDCDWEGARAALAKVRGQS